MSNRHQDSERISSFYESLCKHFGYEPTDEEVYLYQCQNAKLYNISPPEPDAKHRFIGDDLSQKDLDDLWHCFAGESKSSQMLSWWEDKPHQIAYRLLLRLTRAEKEIQELKNQLSKLTSDR